MNLGVNWNLDSIQVETQVLLIRVISTLADAKKNVHSL